MNSKMIVDSIKDCYEATFQNLEAIQKQNESMFEMFYQQKSATDHVLEENFREWVQNCNECFRDYKDMVLNGLNYLNRNAGNDKSSSSGQA
jgi:DNA-binding SARP family transcriptional activator